MKEEMKKDLARDFVALGGIPLFILVVLRIWLLDNPFYLSKLLISGLLFLGLIYFLKFNLYSGLALISLIFTAVYYSDNRYWIFAGVVYVCLIGSLVYLEKKKIYLGILFGLIASGIGYGLSNILF